ncbi:hypothetical protein [Tepidibacter mesophilus]|uniref:hypothetical protein n=1 Tax=Tepidibacter mesophilus TaxID=655607 RepID=UPI0016510B8E|nr:hypothetical protein [Tepidibacter mesophilus]
MNKKNIFLIFSLAVIATIIVLYPKNQSINLDKAEDISHKFTVQKTQEHISNNIKTQEYQLPIPEGGEIGDQTVYGNHVYYIVLYMKEMSNFAQKAEIYQYNIVNKDYKLIFEYKNLNYDIYVNELRANENYLFWENFDPQNNWSLNKFNLSTNEVEPIITSKDTDSKILPSIEVTNKYLAWYEYVNKKAYLMIYSIEKNEIKVIDKNIHLESPYDRAYIRNNKITYLTIDNKNKYINIYNLDENKNKVLNISKNIEIKNVLSNDNFTVWHEDYGMSNVYVYDHRLKKLYLINSKRNGHNIFAINLCKNYIFINDSKKSNIFCFDINNKKKTNLTKKLNNDKNLYTLTTVSADNKFIAQNTTIEGILSLIVTIKK